MKIEIVTTPNSTLKETGFGSAVACDNVMQSLISSDHNATVSTCINAANLASVIAREPDLIIGAVKYILLENGQKIWLSEYFENQGMNFTGSHKGTLSYDSNKESAKRRVASQGIDTANFFTAIPNEYQAKQMLPIPFPVFIKPADAANGNGVDAASLAHNFEQFEDKVQSLYDEYAEPVLVEEYLAGKEFTVAIIENDKNLIIAAVEIIPPEEGGIRVLGAKVKTDNTETLQVIADKETLSKVVDIAEQSFCALGVRDFGRIDIKMDHNGKCYFMEANLLPGMKKGSSYFPEACKKGASLDYDQVVQFMVQGTISRVA